MTKLQRVDVPARAAAHALKSVPCSGPARWGHADIGACQEQADAARALQSRESLAARCILGEMSDLQHFHPAWFYRMEDTDPNTASSEELLQLLRSAPTSFAKGLIFGKFHLRMELAATTGHPF